MVVGHPAIHPVLLATYDFVWKQCTPKSVGVPSFFPYKWQFMGVPIFRQLRIHCHSLYAPSGAIYQKRRSLLMVGPRCLSKPSPYLSISIRVPPFHPLRFWWWLTFPLFWNISMCRTPGLCRCIAWLHMALYSRRTGWTAQLMEKGHLLRKPIPLIWKTP